MVGKKANVRLKYRVEYPGKYNFDYKDPTTLSRFVMDGGKIVPSRISKMSRAQQRKVSKAVKIARTLALLPIGAFAHDGARNPEPISPQPFTP